VNGSIVGGKKIAVAGMRDGNRLWQLSVLGGPASGSSGFSGSDPGTPREKNKKSKSEPEAQSAEAHTENSEFFNSQWKPAVDEPLEPLEPLTDDGLAADEEIPL
jgi:hypothetical protein